MKRGKCLALVAVFAMVVCAFAVALPAGDSDADDHPGTPIENGTGTPVTSWTEVVKTLDSDAKSVILKITDSMSITSSYTVPAGKTLYINGESSGADKNSSGHKITISEGCTLTIAGTVYNNVGVSKKTSDLEVEGTLAFTGSGTMYTTCAISGGNGNVEGAFFTANEFYVDHYKQIFSADIEKVLECVSSVSYSSKAITGCYIT